MSRTGQPEGRGEPSPPRASGDEPETISKSSVIFGSAPRERG